MRRTEKGRVKMKLLQKISPDLNESGTRIISARPEDSERCSEILYGSTLGKRYYPTFSMLKKAVVAGIRNDHFFLAVNGGTICGFIWFAAKGAFALYPYLHIVVVDDHYRKLGIGKKLLDYYEEECLRLGGGLKGRSYLVVSEDNVGAQNLYSSMGYKMVSELPGLFRKGFNEILMTKTILKAGKK